MGGHRGYGLALMWEVLTGLLAGGSRFAGKVTTPDIYDRPQGVSMCPIEECRRVASYQWTHRATCHSTADRAVQEGPPSSMASVLNSPMVDSHNSMIESFWSRIQVELLDRKKWKTRVKPANAIFDYLEIWRNRQRRHSQLRMVTPIEFERKCVNTAA